MNVTTRNATLPDLFTLLQEQHARKLDVVAPASAIRSVEGVLTIKGTDPILTEDGVTTADGSYVPTVVADEGLAAKLGVPVGYLKRTRAERPDLYDANINGWLHGRREKRNLADQSVVREAVPMDPRSFLVRCFRGDNPGEQGIARAFLSSRYGIVDNLDVLLSALDGVKDAGVEVNVRGGDLTERRMVVRVSCPEVAAMAPVLLKGYRSPFTGASGDDNPTVFAGFRITNSEVGGGAFSIVPEVTVQVCDNGMTMTKDAMERTHLGARLEDGVVRWAEDTQRKSLELVKAKARDAVATFLSPEYLRGAVERLERRADQEVSASEEAVRELTKPLGYTDEQVTGIMGHFIKGGQLTRGGVVNAITSYSQTVEDGEAAYALESTAVSLLV